VLEKKGTLRQKDKEHCVGKERSAVSERIEVPCRKENECKGGKKESAMLEQ
jgi:hypothetical protein